MDKSCVGMEYQETVVTAIRKSVTVGHSIYLQIQRTHVADLTHIFSSKILETFSQFRQVENASPDLEGTCAMIVS